MTLRFGPLAPTESKDSIDSNGFHGIPTDSNGFQRMPTDFDGFQRSQRIQRSRGGGAGGGGVEKRANRANGGPGQGEENNVLLEHFFQVSGQGKLEFGRFLGKASLSLQGFCARQA